MQGCLEHEIGSEAEREGGGESRREICALPFSHLLIQPELQASPGSSQLPPTEAQAMP